MCEHCDGNFEEGKRFCSDACRECEAAESSRPGCAAICMVEPLARTLHEAGREAVERGQTQNPGGSFIEWDAAPERTREGRRIQARYLLERYEINPISAPPSA